MPSARIPGSPANWAHAPTQAELEAEIARVLSEWATKENGK